MKTTFAALLCFFTALSANADPVIVQEVSVTPYQVVGISVNGFYSGKVLAGVVNLLVDSVAVRGFCIDPYHFSGTGPQQYNSVPLTSAPKGHMMSASAANLIGRLWAIAYSANMTAQQAAGLQIAIWMVTGGSDFHLTTPNDYGAAALLVAAQNYNGAIPSLIGLTGPGQDYVIAGSLGVPDAGTTATLFALALAALILPGRFARRTVSIRSNERAAFRPPTA